MSDSFSSVALAVALATVMFGVGLALTLDDFRRLIRYPRAAVVALTLQTLFLPLVAYAIVRATGLSVEFGIGLMVLAAAPGGVIANVFSHLFGGNVALNVTLTAVNTVLASVTLPIILDWSIKALSNESVHVPFVWAKVLEVIGVVLAPIAVGMLVASRHPRASTALARPMKLLSGAVLVVLVGVSIVREWATISGAIFQVGGAVLAFNLISLLTGYVLSRMATLDRSMAIAIAFEIGIHNSTLAMYIAIQVLGAMAYAVPAAIYAVSMLLTATAFGFWLRRFDQRAAVNQHLQLKKQHR